MNDINASGIDSGNPQTRVEYIAQYCFKLPGLATQIEDFVGMYMQEREGMYERQKKEEIREKARNTAKMRADATRVLKLLRLTIFRDAEKIAENLMIDRPSLDIVLNNLMTSRRIKRVSMGGRDVYHLLK
jgi:hypothetical protein